ncbi:MAG TPA: SprB repeat-containing protein, partial [Bacteroidia bacterium]
MRKYLRNILFVLALFCTQLFMAQKLYWVGSSGNFNDAAHWSYTSGGVGGTKTPTATSDVYFDENSFSGQSLINFIGSTQVHDLIFSEYTPKVIFSGLQNEKITIHGNLSLNAYIENHFVGEIWLTSNQVNTSVSFALTKLKGNIYFNGNTTWLIPTNILADDNSTVYFKQGIFNLNNTSINSGNLIASAGVTINSNQTTFRITNKFVLPNGVVFNDTKSTIRAYTKDPAKFQVAPTITFNTNSRLNNLNNVMTACNITGSSTQPTCSGNCDGTITFNIPAAECSGSDTIFLHWANSINCTTQLRDTFFTSGSPSTYSVGDICACLDQYPSIFSNNIAEDTVYASPLGVSMANPRPPQIQNPFTPFPPSCFGKCDGKIVMNIAIGSGVAPLTSTWTLPSGGTVVHTPLGNTTTNHHDTLKLACAGIYTVSLTDVHGCTSAISTTVLAQPTKVVSTPTFTNPLCSGSCTGIIQDNPSGGIPPYICTMDSAGGAGPNLAMPGCSVSGLCAGTYTVFAKDAHGCKDTNFVTIVPPPAITFLTSGTSTISCLNACNGSVSVTNVLGGTPFTVGNAYTYSWSPPGVGTMTNTTNSSTYSGLCGSVAGITYTCTIKDSNNCVKTTTFMIKAPPALTLTPTHTNPKCNLSIDGSATVTASGGAPAYTFTWAPQSGTTGGVSPKSIYSGIGGGTYTAYVTDANGCLDSTTVTLIPPPAITGTMTTVTPPTCPNLNNGHMCVTAGGGTPGPGYTYTWSPNPPAIGTASCTPNTLTVTPGGTSVYNVTITDANSCTLTVTGILTSPPLVAVTASVTSPPCSGSSNGSATLTATGGNGVFSYQWSCSIITTSVVTGQPGGTFCNYTVTDGNSCRTTGTVNFTLPTPLTLSLTPTTLACA